MRPLELDLTAFRSYDRATVDLRGHDLVVITGDTGAGKTSLLDAISFALFGTTPEKSGPKDLLTLGRTHGEVRLTFSARGEVWRMTRRYGPDAPEPTHVLERLDGDGGPALETIGGEEAVGARLTAVVGMSFRAFTSAVLLAQGRFAEFLGAQPRERDAILRELFGVASLEGARQAAVAHVAAAEGEARAHDAQAARLPEHGAGARADAARSLRAASARHAAARALAPLAAAAEEHAAASAGARARADAARTAAGDLPDEHEAAALLERLGDAERACAEARERHEAAMARAAAAAGARDALHARHGGDGAELAALGVRAEAAGRLAGALPGRRRGLARREKALARRGAPLEELRAALAASRADRQRAAAQAAAAGAWRAAQATAAGASAALASARGEAAAAGERRASAEAALTRAEEAHRALRRRDLAATIRAELSPGDPCPVCGAAIGDHTVETGDLHAGEAALAAARDAAATAAREQAAADERARAAERDAAAAQEGLAAAEGALGDAGLTPREAVAQGEALTERAGALDAAIAAAERGVAGEEQAIAVEASVVATEREAIARDEAELAGARAALGAWADHDDAAAALAAALGEVRAAEREAQSAAAAAAAAAERAAVAAQALGELAAGPFATLRSVAARVAARGGLAAPADDLVPVDLVPAAVRLRVDALAAAAAHDDEARRGAARADGARAALVAAGGPLGVDDPSQVAGATRRLGAAREAARARLAEVEAAAHGARRLAGDAAAARARARVHQQVANDLRANMFPRFLLNRYQERLAAGASVRLQELTGGAYRFSGRDQDALAVVDTRRGERLRRAATLSGGERFLASLALALGLSDIAAESGGRLDSLFLDEGFSTLDADSLEQAMSGIERLAGDGRLVAVITHLPGVADRLGAVIHVEKDPAGVSRVSDEVTPELAASAAAGRFPA